MNYYYGPNQITYFRQMLHHDIAKRLDHVNDVLAVIFRLSFLNIFQILFQFFDFGEELFMLFYVHLHGSFAKLFLVPRKYKRLLYMMVVVQSIDLSLYQWHTCPSRLNRLITYRSQSKYQERLFFVLCDIGRMFDYSVDTLDKSIVCGTHVTAH